MPEENGNTLRYRIEVLERRLTNLETQTAPLVEVRVDMAYVKAALERIERQSKEGLADEARARVDGDRQNAAVSTWLIRTGVGFAIIVLSGLLVSLATRGSP